MKKYVIGLVVIFIVGIGVLFWLYRPIHDELDGKFYLDNKYYGSDKFIKVSNSELAKVKNKSYVLFTYNNYCTFPISCESIFQEFMSKYNISFLSIPFEEFRKTSFYEEVKYGPSVILVYHGKIVSYLDANSDEDLDKYQNALVFEDWLDNYIYFDKK